MTTLEETIKVVLDQDLESSVDGHRRQPCIACLLKAFDEQPTVGHFIQDMRVEVVALDAFGIRQDDLSHAECRELRPQAPHHFRARQREQHIDLRAWGGGGRELAAKSDSAFTC